MSITYLIICIQCIICTLSLGQYSFLFHFSCMNFFYIALIYENGQDLLDIGYEIWTGLPSIMDPKLKGGFNQKWKLIYRGVSLWVNAYYRLLFTILGDSVYVCTKEYVKHDTWFIIQMCLHSTPYLYHIMGF